MGLRMSQEASVEASLESPGEVKVGSSGGWSEVSLLLPSVVAVGWLVSKLQWVWTHRPEMQFGWIVLFLSGFLWWEKWASRPRVDWQFGWMHAVAMALGVGFLGWMQVYQAAFGTNAASLCGHALGTLWVVGANLHWVYGGLGLKALLFPLLFLFVALPMPSFIQNPVTHGLQSLVTAINVETLNLCGIPAMRSGNLIELPGGTVGVDEACSGIRSLQSSLMATVFIGYLMLRSNGLRLLLLGGGVIMAVLGNLLRSLYLSYTASRSGVEAVALVHDAAGWWVLVFTATGVAGIAWMLGKVERRAMLEGSLSVGKLHESP